MSEVKKQGDDFIQIKDLLGLFRQYWCWFIISAVVCLGVAFTYIVVTPPRYTREASVLIKNEDQKGSSISQSTLGEFGLFKPNSNVESEAHIFQSTPLMEAVVRRLKLDKNYQIKYKKLRPFDLYTATPILVELDSTLQDSKVSFTVDLLSPEEVSISYITVNDFETNEKRRGKLSEPIRFSWGEVTVTPTVFYENFMNKTIHFSKRKISGTTKKCKKALEVKVSDDDAPIINLSYVDVNPQRANDVLNTLIAVYNESWIKDKNQLISSTSNFIDERLNVIEGELGNVDEDISSYKSENLIPDIGAVSNMYLTQSSSNASQLIALQNQLSLARYIRSYLDEGTKSSQLLPANSGIESNSIENLIDKYNTILLQKNNLVANSSEQNPIVSDMTQSLNSMKEAIVMSVDDYISTLNIQLQNIRNEEKSMNQKIASSPNQAKHLLSIERQQKVKEELYLFLLQKREENELSQTFTAYNTKIVNYPDGSNSPTVPRKYVVLLAGLLIGLVLPAIILFIIESLNTLVRDKKDLNVLDIPFLGEIPLTTKAKKNFLSRFIKKKDKDSKVEVVVADKNRDIVNEAFRNIRTNIDFMRPKTHLGTVIMTTSMYLGSGKTFSTLNIALSMAIKGAKTIILDVDIRKASLSTVVDSPREGLSNYLNGNEERWESLLAKKKLHENLDILPAGLLPPNPSELLLKDDFPKLINELKTQYDYIFLDCPPVSIVADTAIIAPVSDLTLYIIRAGLMDKRSLPEVEQFYKDGHVKSMAVILNGLDFTSEKYGYRRYGYHKYGYSYGEY